MFFQMEPGLEWSPRLALWTGDIWATALHPVSLQFPQAPRVPATSWEPSLFQELFPLGDPSSELLLPPNPSCTPDGLGHTMWPRRETGDSLHRQPQDTSVPWAGEAGEWGTRDRSTPCRLSVRCGQRTRRVNVRGKVCARCQGRWGAAEGVGRGERSLGKPHPRCPGEGDRRAHVEKP